MDCRYSMLSAGCIACLQKLDKQNKLVDIVECRLAAYILGSSCVIDGNIIIQTQIGFVSFEFRSIRLSNTLKYYYRKRTEDNMTKKRRCIASDWGPTIITELCNDDTTNHSAMTNSNNNNNSSSLKGDKDTASGRLHRKCIGGNLSD